eukprot:UN00634
MLSPSVIIEDDNSVQNQNESVNVSVNVNVGGKEMGRDDIYGMAESIDTNLTSLNERLQIKINQLNQSNQTFKNQKHPLTPVVDILNNHMASLNWIDQKTQEISQKINQIQNNIPK